MEVDGDSRKENDTMDGTYMTEDTAGIEPLLPTREKLKKQPVRGWFSFLLFSIILGGVLSITMAFKYDDESIMAISLFFGTLHFQIGAIMLGVGLYAATRVWQRQADAIFWLRFYLIFCFLTNMISVWSNDGLEGFTDYEKKSVVQCLVLSVVWLLYLAKSTQVADIFPKAYRKTTATAKTAAFFLLALPFISFGLGCFSISHRAENWNAIEYSLSDLPVGIGTDGHVKFLIPHGADYELAEAEGGRVAVLSKVDEYFGCVFSSPYPGEEEDTFEDIRIANRDETFMDASESLMDAKTDNINGHNVRIKTTRLVSGEYALKWRFAAIYDMKSRKTAYLSFYDNLDSPEYFEALMKSLDF